MTSAEFRELALMTSEDFDGRLHTYAIGIKLALGSNLQTCIGMQSNRQDGAKLALDQTCKTCNPSVRLGPGCRPRNQAFWGLRRLGGVVYINEKRTKGGAHTGVSASVYSQVVRQFW